MVWYAAIEKAASTDGNALQDQQLSKNDVPIIVNSCIAFVTQYGKYIYIHFCCCRSTEDHLCNT